MGDLLNKYNDYRKLVGCKIVYCLEDGQLIEVTFKEYYFPHLLGLHKLKDINLINKWQNRKNSKVKTREIIKSIKNETLNDTLIKKSSFYTLIKDRYNSFSFDRITTLIYTNAIINFNPNIIHSKLISDFILYEKDINNEYNHLAIGINHNNGERFIETYFHERTDKYIVNQKIMRIKCYRLIDKNNVIIFEDYFY